MKKYMSMNILDKDGAVIVREYEGEMSTIHAGVFLIPMSPPPEESFVALLESTGTPRMDAISIGLNVDALSDTPEDARQTAQRLFADATDPEAIAYVAKAATAPIRVLKGEFTDKGLQV